MEHLGEGRVFFQLRTPPPSGSVLKTSRGDVSRGTEVFEPYQESLPLQSGWYSFIIDADGHFRVIRGNAKSHASLSPDRRAAAAGRFSVNRMGQVIEVIVRSRDFNCFFKGPNRFVTYITQSFERHYALRLNPRAIFRFYKDMYESWCINASGLLIADPREQLLSLEGEGLGETASVGFTHGQVARFALYQPDQPSCLYAMHHDQCITSLEDDDSQPFAAGPASPRFTPEFRLSSGKNNFVIDREGWMVLGACGHQILSGGHGVGGAGHVYIDRHAIVSRIETNFSGHYRPTLTGDYLRYVCRTMVSHPLLTIADNCTLAGRVFKDCDAVSKALDFRWEEVEEDSDRLDLCIESYF